MRALFLLLSPVAAIGGPQLISALGLWETASSSGFEALSSKLYRPIYSSSISGLISKYYSVVRSCQVLQKPTNLGQKEKKCPNASTLLILIL